MNDDSQILSQLKDLNSRISRIESYLSLSNRESSDEAPSELNRKKTEDEKKSIEFEIGQFWFAKAGIVVLALGIAFILSLPFSSFPSFFPSLLGLVISLVLFGISKLWKKSFNLISRYLFGSAFLLLFFSTLRLHYWGDPTFISNNFYEFILLSVIALGLLFVSVKKESTHLFNIGLTLGYISALVSGDAYIIFCTILVLTTLSSYIKINFEWGRLFYYSIFLTYLTHLIWFINNPIIIGNKIGLVSEPYINIFFLMLYLVIIAVGNIYRKVEFHDDKLKIMSSFFNSVGFILLFTFITTTQFSSEITISFIAASILFLLLAFLFWKKERDKYSIFFFSILGYIALSISFMNAFEIPELFIWLSWQSILVVTTAILFRSKIIIVANFLIYLILVLGTLFFASGSAISFVNIAIVSLLSARILNSQKDNLDLKTEAMRNAYLSIAFLLLPYATFLLAPIEYVGFTWLGIAILYYAFSMILKNNKYRWMAMMTLAITILYTLVLGILHPDNEFKVIAFITVGVVLIIISFVYAKVKPKNNVENE
ncbi:MAG: DUF2339 domain-containing protein [Melioribacteraceae bacterium]|nr:DUF2339 domain-containing protein [Melioribacteraceae bacterium]